MRTVVIVSHTLDERIRRRLKRLAYHEQLSESAIIEGALRMLFDNPSNKALGDMLRERGARLRRQRPLQRGARLLMNAATPSRKSALP